jgi:hypothetical protein
MLASSVIEMLASTSSSRSILAQSLGYEYQGDRDVYTALGYTKTVVFDDYEARYRRGDLARRIIKEPVGATWRSVPVVNESVPDEVRKTKPRTDFEIAWDALVGDKQLKVYHNLRKADLVSGIGRWGVIFLGFNDVESATDFVKSVEKSTSLELLYLSPLNEAQAKIHSFVTDATNPRFGKPEFYDLEFQRSASLRDSAVRSTPRAQGDDTVSSMTVRVHWSRVIHLAEESDESGVVGAPRLEAVFNRLMDLDRVVGSTGEAFWRNAFPGVQAKLDEDFQFSDKQDLDELKTQLDDFVHRWERYIRTQGVTLEQLDAQVAQPKESFEVIISVISGTTGIPQRILLGSERGELSSTQDQSQYAVVIEERRKQYVEPVMLDQFIARLIGVGLLPEAKAGWTYVWPEVFPPSPKEKAEVSRLRTESLTKYTDSLAGRDLIPPSVFLRQFLNFSEDEAAKIEELLAERAAEALAGLDDEGREMDEDNETDVIEEDI